MIQALPAILGLVGSLAGTAASTATGIMTNNYNAYQTERGRQHQMLMLQNQQNWAAQQAAEADRRTRALYNDLQSPSAMRQQIEDAGLSVGMLYGMGGQGGQMSSGAQAATPTGATTQMIPATNPLGIDAAQLLAQTGRTLAETANIEADTDLKKAGLSKTQQEILKIKEEVKEIDQKIAESRQKVDNMVAEKLKIAEETNNLKEQANLIRAQERYNNAMAKIEEINALTLNEKNSQEIERLKAAIKEMEANASKLGAEEETIKQTRQHIVDKLKWEALETQQIYEQLTPAQITKLRAEYTKINLENMREQEIRNTLTKLGLDRGTANIVIGILRAIAAAIS